MTHVHNAQCRAALTHCPRPPSSIQSMMKSVCTSETSRPPPRAPPGPHPPAAAAVHAAAVRADRSEKVLAAVQFITTARTISQQHFTSLLYRVVRLSAIISLAQGHSTYRRGLPATEGGGQTETHTHRSHLTGYGLHTLHRVVGLQGVWSPQPSRP